MFCWIALGVHFVASFQDLDEAAKHILEALDQRKLQEVGEKVGVGKFRTAALEKNKKLSMFNSDQTAKTAGELHLRTSAMQSSVPCRT